MRDGRPSRLGGAIGDWGCFPQATALTGRDHLGDGARSPTVHMHTHPPTQQEPLKYDPEHHALVSESIGVRYPINKETGVPNLIPAEAKVIRSDDVGE